ncbi:MAG: N-acetyltransferase [Pseudomonadota bacterium]
MFRLLPETPDDTDEVEWLFDTAFAPGRTALSSYRLRDGVGAVPGLSHIARDEFDVIGGAVRFWPIRIGAEGAPGLLLGPIAVHPTRQGEGLGGILMRTGLQAAAQAGWARVLLVGDAPYYARFGFEPQPRLEFPPPTNPKRVLGLSLVPGALEGCAGPVRPWDASQALPTGVGPACL